jgi:hypothetical protein
LVAFFRGVGALDQPVARHGRVETQEALNKLKRDIAANWRAAREPE